MSVQISQAEALYDFRKISGDDRNWGIGQPTPLDQYRERLIRRFWAKVDKTPGLGPWGNCWEWRGSMDRKDKISYGNIGVSGSQSLALGFKTSVNVQKAHTAAWIVVYGHTIPTGHEMCHKCNHKPCVREDHLFTATHLFNIRHAQTTGLMPTRKPKPEPDDYRVWLSESQYHAIRAARKTEHVSIIDAAYMAQMDVSHLSLIERGKRAIRLTQLIFLLQFLKIDRDEFGLATCELIPTRRIKDPTAKYLQKKPAYVYRATPYEQFAQRRPPRWYDSLGEISTDSYNAHALIDAFRNAGIKQGDIARGTDLRREDVRQVLRGHATSDRQLLAVLRYAEAVTSQAKDL